MNRVFVYGTLKRSASAYKVLQKYGQYEGQAVTTQKFGMLTTGTFPVMVEYAPDNHKHKVEGEVYLVSDEVLAKLDAYESVGYMYERRRMNVFLPLARTSKSAFVYVGSPEYWRGSNAAKYFNGINKDGNYVW